MKNFLIAILGSIGLLLPGVAFAYNWSIESIYVDVTVQEDGMLYVEEDILVDFDVEKHGIFRYIPVVYRSDTGDLMKLKFDIETVWLDGIDEPYDVSWYGAAKMIKIGDANVTMTGEHLYTIAYTVDRAVLFEDGFDEVYWNVTGNDWEVPIKSVAARVILPDGTEIISQQCYTGESGSTAQDCGGSFDGNIAAFFTQNNYLTVAVSFPKGIISEPTFGQQVLWFIKDNWLIAIPILIVLFVIWAWFKYGRDPRMATVVAEYEAPDRVTPVYAGLLVKGMIPKSMFAAMIVHMAVEGYLKIRVEGKSKFSKKIFVEKLKDDKGLDYAHTKLLNAMFKDGEKERSLKDLKYALDSYDVNRIKKALHDKLIDDGVYVKNSKKRRSLFVAIAAIMMFVAVYWGAYWGSITAIVYFLGALVTFIFAMFMPKKTAQGNELVRKVLGFKLFIHTAERYRAEWQEKENIFEKVLPYAIAFGEVKQWAKAFKDMEFKNPDWYQSNVPITSFAVFSNSLMSTVSTIHSTTAPQASSSASGGASFGGGSSGGGFGGGGGGSW